MKIVSKEDKSSNLGLPNNVPYLALNASNGNAGVVFAVARSPILDSSFFKTRGIQIPPSVVPLSGRFTWFKTYLQSVCSTPRDCANRLGNSLIFLGDNEANDIGYALTQGKSIEEVSTYVPLVTQALVDATRELIKMGATRIALTGSAPLGCYPYILTALQTNDPLAYDNLGCLKRVNNLILSKNAALQAAILKLKLEFPFINILYADIYGSGLGTSHCKLVVELEENITTTARGFVVVPECPFALTQTDTYTGMAYTIPNRLTRDIFNFSFR
ncbi:hypothetical protein DH2020_004949 [Rehmannia glutinosa]|uniref:GDSL esterase/lipase n=1 Tax=Rehmannia glutinosa TaxID=99300 RepID=A0ABR0XQT3_REHGL